MPTPASSEGGGTPGLEAVLTEDNDANSGGIDNLGATNMDGNLTLPDGGDVRAPGSGVTPTRIVFNAASGAGGDMTASASNGTAGNSGGNINLQSGTGNAGADAAALMSMFGGDGFGGAGYTDVYGNFQLRTGVLLSCVNAAPADAAIGTGRMAIWFDKTNGAAKLMVKAKQANGTVVTASVALA